MKVDDLIPNSIPNIQFILQSKRGYVKRYLNPIFIEFYRCLGKLR